MQMDAINKYSKLDLPVAPTLWLECHGTEASVAEQADPDDIMNPGKILRI
jgi:D-lactate dehydrogenase (cytochrome)